MLDTENKTGNGHSFRFEGKTKKKVLEPGGSNYGGGSAIKV